MNVPFLRTCVALFGLFLLLPFASAVAAPPTGGNPANDDCAGAIELVVTPTCSPVVGEVAGATQSIPAITCSGNIGTADDDVWYWFTATNTSQMIEVVGSSGFNAVIDLRTGACNGTNYRCTDLADAGGTEILTATNLTIGTVYYVRIYSRDAAIPATTTFTICVHDPVAPVNNDCGGSITLVPSPVCSPISGTVAFATQSIPAIDCNGFTGNANDDVWFNFTATETSHTIQMVLGAGWDEVLDLRSGACNGTNIACSDSPTMVATGLTVGETYYLRVYHYFNGAPTNTSFTICLLGASPSGCNAVAGTITADASPVCLVAGSADVSATPDGNAAVPVGYETAYVLTQGASLVIMDAGATPSFTVTAADDYTIHTLVYDPNTLDLGTIVPGVTTGFDVNALLIQGGGSICGSLDVTGAPIVVEECITCDALAGALVADASPVCLVAGSADISATPDGNAVVPIGYETAYVLTQGAGLVIMDAGATPSFTVTAADDYTIHTLVYDPNTLDLGTIVPGVTTGFDVNALLIQGGGSICGSLDVTGAPIVVEECITCDANAGALVANETPVCLVGGSANIVATPDGNAVVPVGYETLFVLTQGPGLVIVGSSLAPDFSVLAADTYTIHTLVYDPNTLDLGFIVPGTTTAAEIDALLIQGGGSICGSLDVTGAFFEVTECVVCDANAGTLTADQTPVCLFGGFAQIGATPNGDAVEPDGYATDYVLAQGPGLVIIGLNGGPVFSVNAPGSYTIHTIIYDPLTVDVGLIELGVTTAFDIDALLIQGGGTICGSLDMLGAAISVNDCAPGNDNCVNAVPLAVNLASACPGAATPGDNTYATTDGSVPSCADPAAEPLDVWYTFNSGANTTVTITLDPGTMEDWAVVVRDGCNGNELACVVLPVAPIDLLTDPNTDYVIEVYSDHQIGNGGEFSICVSGDVPTLVCDGGSVQTTTGAFAVDVCQDLIADIIDFATTTASAESYTFLLTDESNVVIAQLAGGSLDFNSAALGVYRVWGISYNGDLVGADPGSIATEITSTGSCVDLSDNFVQVNVEICFGLLDADASSWNLFPNPGNGDFTLVYAGNDALTTMEIVDMDGRVVYSQQQLMTRGVSTQIALHGQLAQGVYVVRLTNTAGSNTMRLVVR